MSIIVDKICVGNKSTFAQLIKNNLYIMDISGPPGFAFLSINGNTLKTYYAQLGHLGRQNIIWLTKKIANNIDLTKPLPHSAYEPYSISNLQTEPYRNKIELGLELLDFMHNDMIDSFINGLYRATHFDTFFYDATKRSKVVF